MVTITYSDMLIASKSQVHTHWEALIVDDGSSDGTINFLRDLTYSDSRFRLFYKPTNQIS